MIRIRNFAENQYFEIGLKAIVDTMLNTETISHDSYLVIIDKAKPLKGLLELRHDVSMKNASVVVFSDDMSADFVATITGNAFHVEVLPERVSLRMLLSVLKYPGKSRKRRMICFSYRELSLLKAFEKYHCQSLTIISYKTNQSIKTLSSHKRNIMAKIGASSSGFLFQLLNDPCFSDILTLL